MIDNRTDRLSLLLPDADNYLEEDVKRIEQTFQILDAKVATVNDEGRLEYTQLPKNVSLLDASGKIPTSQIPALAIVDTYTVNSEASMLALKCQQGDIAIRSDLSKSFILAASPPDALANWKELLSTAVASVNGKTGIVVVAEAGENHDITKLLGLIGPLRLGGDASDPYDAVTLRQLQASSGGSGASMTGVMNNFLGGVQWFNGTRALLPAGHIAGDGQLLNRAEHPDLWAAVNSGMFVSVTEAVWQADPTKRGCYSTGNGTTTFRVPDFNGKQSGSIPGLFQRGDGSVAVGTVQENAVPNILGKMGVAYSSQVLRLFLGQTSGALKADPNSNSTSYSVIAPGAVTTTSDSNRYSNMTFDASLADPAYGRGETTEVRPNSVVGIWIIRANGAFSAAGTNFNVINSDTALPANGTLVSGGEVRSVYRVAGADYSVARLRASVSIGGVMATVLNITDPKSGVGRDTYFPLSGGMEFREDAGSYGISWKTKDGASEKVSIRMSYGDTSGNAYADGDLVLDTGNKNANFNRPIRVMGGGEIMRLVNPTGGGCYIMAHTQNVDTLDGRRWYLGNTGSDNNLCQLVNAPVASAINLQPDGRIDIVAKSNGNGNGTSRVLTMRTDGQMIGPLGTVTQSGSDVRLKGDIVEAADGAGERIDALCAVEYTMLMTGERERGWIAQQVDAIDPLYSGVGGTAEDVEGNEFDIINVKDRAIMADLVTCVQSLRAEVADLKAKLDAK